MQTDALRTVAEWLDTLAWRPVGTVEVRPDGDVWLHVEPAAGQPRPDATLRALTGIVPDARLTVESEVRRLGNRYGRRLELRPQVPELELVLWCYETMPVPRLTAVAR